MRRTFIITCISCLLSATAALAAGPQPQQSARDLECKYSGDCKTDAADANEPTQPKGPTKGFSLRRFGTAAAPASDARSVPGKVHGRGATAMNAPAARRVGVSHGDLLITFASGSAQITPQGMANARAFAEALQRPKLSGMRFRISGHTDAVGTREANLELSRRRAEAVADFLAAQGVARDRLKVEGRGFDEPVAGTSPVSPVNRRVEAEKLSDA